jgi:hypothetical protein
LLREPLRTRPGCGAIIGVSERKHRVYERIQKVSRHDYPVLILDESGTGQQLVARSLHFSRTPGPSVCSGRLFFAGATLIKSELFGYVKDALHGKQGLMEAAHGGTLFLDEIGEMPVDCSRSCCGCCSSVRSSPSARPSAAGSMCVSSPRRIAISKVASRPAHFGRTFISARALCR